MANHERRCAGFDDKILALSARGMTVREIQGVLADRSAVEVSPDLTSTVTDAVVAEVTAWQSRPLEPMYPVVFVEARRVKIRDEATVRRKAVYLALAVWPDGTRDILGIWIEQTEAAKFWMKVFTDLRSRGGHDILIAVTDGHTAMSEAPAAVVPGRRRGTPAFCISFGTAWTMSVGRSARSSPRRAWTQVFPLCAFPPEVRRVIDTTYGLESVHAPLRQIITARGHFPTDEAATTLLWLALRNLTRRWTMPVRPWREAMAQFALLYPERFPVRVE